MITFGSLGPLQSTDSDEMTKIDDGLYIVLTSYMTGDNMRRPSQRTRSYP